MPRARAALSPGRWILALAALVLALAGVGCASGGAEKRARPGSIAPDALRGKSFTVGSKEFTEQVVLGQITLAALRAAGAEVIDETGLAGSVTARRALTSGEIDMYWEYTGTAWITYLDETSPIRDAAVQYEAVARRDLAENEIAWLAYAPFDNTYGVALRREAAGRLGVRSLSDLGRLLRDRPAEATLCVADEFLSRDDGLPGLEKALDVRFPRSQVSKLDEGVIYEEIKTGGRCNFGEVFVTDGRIEANDLVVLEDDIRFFPHYNPALTMRADVLRSAPELTEIFRGISEKLDTATMRRLNARVDVEGLTEEEVAEEWLREKGFIG